MTYEQAKEKALKQMPNADTTIEYDSVYVFYNSKAKGNEQDDNEVVIKKVDGEIISYSDYVMSTNDNINNKKVRKI